jgi:hypothetical protein
MKVTLDVGAEAVVLLAHGLAPAPLELGAPLAFLSCG